jgi:hypothetical protein
MQSMRIAAVTTLVAAGLFAGACGSKDSTGPSISLSQGEVFVLAGELGDVISAVTLVSARTSGGPLLSLVPGPNFRTEGPISQTVNCPMSGTATASGTFGSTTTTETADMTFAFNACKTSHYLTGGSVRVTGNAASTPTTLSIHGTFAGTLTVTASDARSGNCQMDFTVNGSATQTSNLTYTASGNACGVNVAGTY